jgi:predicted AlkP superfamily phosphohydrolase/phosphomutase/tetratricopeptide (TPR) repeat protein
MPDRPTPKVLLLGWDAADWEHIQPLLEQGQLPALQRLIENGVHGNLATLQPILSPMLWNSIATGKQPWKHGVHGFIEPDPHNGGARPWSSHSRKAKALWNILTQRGLRTNVINWWASHPAEPVNGCVVSHTFGGTRKDHAGTWKAPSGAIHPADRAAALAENKVFARELTAEELLPFVPRGAEIDQDNDERLSTLADNVAEMLTTHSVATAVMEREPWDFMAVYFTAIDHFSHAFMPYHPPRLPWVPERDFELYKDVIAGAYRFHDLMLQRYMDLAGPDATIVLCSDHGFHSRQLRPAAVPNEPAGAAFWHRKFGIFAACGPGIQRGGKVFGASLLDIAPTILALFGLPAGEDMDGRVLGEIFVTPPAAGTIPSWESEPGDYGALPPEEAPADPAENEELMRQFVALGYIEAPGATKEEQGEAASIEATYNLARNLNWCSRHDEAIPLLLDLVHRSPWESRFIAQLARCAVAAGNFRMARRIVESAWDLSDTRDPLPHIIMADILTADGETAAACDLLRRLESTLWHPTVLNQMARHLLRFHHSSDAERLFRKSLRIHEDNAEAWEGLSIVHCRQGRNQEAADAALKATSLIFRLPKAHLSLGIALARSGDVPSALTALRHAVHFDPDLFQAHRWLALLLGYAAGDKEAAAVHRREAARIRDTALRQKIRRFSAADTEWALPEFPDEATRALLLAEKRPPPESPAILSGKTFTLVSGLPRSGTSLMMQMLAAAGLPPMTDGERSADTDNPEGYYEWEAIKGIGSDPGLLHTPDLEQKAIKVISMLLPQLPYQHRYRIIFMHRPVEQVAASQQKMVQHRGTEGAGLDSTGLAASLAAHRDKVLTWLRKHPRAELLEVDYPALIADPAPWVEKLRAFLSPELLPRPEDMTAAVKPSLFRNRSTPAPAH